jgi:integrase
MWSDLVESYRIKRLKTPVVSKKKTKKRSVAAVNREILLLSRIFRLAIREKQTAENPCREVELPKEQGRTRYLLPEEEDRLMAVLTGSREHLRSLVIMAINTGMRESELFRLKPEDVDFHRNVIYVRETKNDEDREVPMNKTARDLLRSLMEQVRAKGHRYIFANPKTGNPYTMIKTAWWTACRLAGINDLRFHDLRHTFGTRAADAGVPLSAIAKVMGHKSTQTTERYAHATDEGKRRAVEAAERKPQTRVPNTSQLKAVGE